MNFFGLFILSLIYTYVISYMARRKAFDECYTLFHQAIDDQIKSEERKFELKERMHRIFEKE